MHKLLLLKPYVVEKGIDPQLGVPVEYVTFERSVKLTLAALDAVHVMQASAFPISSADIAMLPGKNDDVPLTVKFDMLVVPFTVKTADEVVNKDKHSTVLNKLVKKIP